MAKNTPDSKSNLLLLFDRPQEPVFVPKGNQQAVFDLPDPYWTDKYKPLQGSLGDRFGEDTQEVIPLSKITIPDLTEIMELPRDANFSWFMPTHRNLARRLTDIFLRKFFRFPSLS